MLQCDRHTDTILDVQLTGIYHPHRLAGQKEQEEADEKTRSQALSSQFNDPLLFLTIVAGSSNTRAANGSSQIKAAKCMNSTSVLVIHTRHTAFADN